MTQRSISADEVRFFSGSSNKPLAAGIAAELGVPLAETHIKRFSNDNLYIQLGASVRYRRVYIVQSLSDPVNDNLMELLMMLDIARDAAASEIHAIIPYYSFGRSDKKDAPRISITARLVADLLKTAGATHVMSMMFHSPQVHGFFRIPTDPLSSRPVFGKYLENRDLSGTIIISPDMGQAKSAARFARSLNLPVAAGNKERVSDTEVRISGLVGNQVKGHKRALIYDDEIATGGSILELSRLLIEEGVEEILVMCTHGVFTRGGLERLADVPQITEIVTTDTVYLPEEKRHPKLNILPVASIFAESIRHNYNRESIGDLFVFGE
ncbi:MAG TPA: ribose-phosphate pyrophosphokinase [Anaerolineales bacterium]|nr:ribose-phosphate pyrophosphokinase [Anaerolineae bacterium]HRJ55448.1 ribose-phosphate pyrophosphokinase [Anaerolineales bacterium]HRK91135.1 ribose-phosphate pyrophosphokinase [Anaerolineales bacterium]